MFRSKEECMELQPLTNSQDGERYYREGKGILCRMPRVMSDDTSQEDDSYTPPQETKIGAGLPLLQRLKLLKEKQDKEAIEGFKPTPEKNVPKEEPEVIGAGLPLLQRLLLLKQKEDCEKEVNTIQITANETAQVLASTVRTQFRSPPLSATSQKCKDKSKEEDPPLKSIILTRVSSSKKTSERGDAVSKNGGISWKDDYGKIETKHKEEVLGDVNGDFKGDELKLELNVNKQLPKVRPQLKLQTLFKQGMKQNKTDMAPSLEKPINGTIGSTKTADDNLGGSVIHNEHTDSAVEPTLPDLIESECKVSENGSKTFSDLKVEQTNKSMLEASRFQSCENSSNNETTILSQKNKIVKSNQYAQEPMSAQTSSSIKDNNSKTSYQTTSNKDSVLIDIDVPSDDQQARFSNINRLKQKPRSLKVKGEHKMYKSIDDLSPEYTGLPFVKQLKILNERQKLVELQDRAFMRSSSLDSGNVTDSKEFNQIYNRSNLTRSHSEAVAIEVVLRNQYRRAQATEAQKSECAQTLPQHTLNPDEHLNLTSPESNETVERRHLKSILKKLSSTSITSNSGSSECQPILSNSPAELRKLMRAQTVEGYAARHSKFTKSVTFNRDTVQSPPSGSSTPSTQPNNQFAKVMSCLNSSPSNKARILPDAQHTSQHHGTRNSGEIVSGGRRMCCCVDTSVAQSSPALSVQPSMSVTTGTISAKLSEISELRTTNCTNTIVQSELKESKPLESHRKLQGNWIEPPQAKQKNFFRPGSILLPTHASQEEEFFGGILSGIKTIIQNHLVSISQSLYYKFYKKKM